MAWAPVSASAIHTGFTLRTQTFHPAFDARSSLVRTMGREVKVSMKTLVTLIDIACGRPIPVEDSGRARRLLLTLLAMLFALGFAALWGLAAGSQSTALAIANAYKVPMVILTSCLFAAPAGFLTWRLFNAPVRGSDLALSFVSSIFGGTLVLVVLAPLVALYYHSSAWAGPMLGIGSAALALLVGSVNFVRGVSRRLPEGTKRSSVMVPVMVTA